MKKSLCVLLALGFGSYLLADTKLDTKVISASGFETSLADTSYNLLVLTGDEIKERGYKDIKEALSSLPNVSIVTTGMGDSIDIRGQGDKANKRVRIFVDGMLLNQEDTSHLAVPFDSINIEDVEQIEVIPGGGSVVYGDGAVGGVINIITKASLSKEYANAYFKIGSFSHKSFGGGFGHKLNDKLYANVNFNIINEKGYQWADINEFVNANFGFRYTPDDKQSLALNIGIMQNDTRSSFALTKEQMKQNRRYGGFEKGYTFMGFVIPDKYADEQPTTRNDKKDISLKYQNDINDNFMLQIMPYYTEFNFDTKAFTDKKKGIKLNTKTTFDISTTHIGYEFLNNQGLRDSTANNDVKKQSHSIYAIESLKLGDMFNLDFGARYEKAKYNVVRSSKDTSYSDSTNKDAFGANIVFGLNITDENKIYTKIEKGYTLPGAYELTDKKDGNKYTTNNINPEDYMSYELGYRGILADTYVGLTGFYTTTKDEIYIDMSSKRGKVMWEWQNISKTERYGAELALSQSFFDDKLELYENLGYISAKVKNDDKHKERQGEKIPQISPFNASLGFSWAVINELKLRGDYNYFSKSKWYFKDEVASLADKSDNDKDAYGVLNLGITYLPTKNLTLSFDAKNVLGEEYNVSCGKDSTCNPAPKQSFYAEFRYKY